MDSLKCDAVDGGESQTRAWMARQHKLQMNAASCPAAPLLRMATSTCYELGRILEVSGWNTRAHQP